jgi:hypothetical protein
LRYCLKNEIADKLNISVNKMVDYELAGKEAYNLSLPIWRYKNKKNEYLISLANIDTFNIEAENGTAFTYEKDKDNIETYIIGSTNTLNLNPLAFEIFYENKKMYINEAMMPPEQAIVPLLINLTYTINIVKIGG